MVVSSRTHDMVVAVYDLAQLRQCGWRTLDFNPEPEPRPPGKFLRIRQNSRNVLGCSEDLEWTISRFVGVARCLQLAPHVYILRNFTYPPYQAKLLLPPEGRSPLIRRVLTSETFRSIQYLTNQRESLNKWWALLCHRPAELASTLMSLARSKDADLLQAFEGCFEGDVYLGEIDDELFLLQVSSRYVCLRCPWEHMHVSVRFRQATDDMLTCLGLQSRCGDKLLAIRVIYMYICVNVQCSTKGYLTALYRTAAPLWGQITCNLVSDICLCTAVQY